MNKVVNNIKAYVIVMVLAVMGFVTNSWAIGGLYDGIMVTPYYGTVGISATLTTNNDIAFDSNEQVRIDFGTIQSLTTVTADTEGNFLLPFTIPIHNAGIATITATGLSSMRATTTTFAVLNLSITPVTGTVGTIITVTGEGYTDDEYIIIFFGTSSLNPITSTYANTAGSFSTTFTANFQSSSTVNVKAKGSSDRLANTTFYLPDQLIIEPDATTVKAGEIVTYTAIARSSVGGSWTVTDNTTFGIDNTIAGSMTTHGIFTASKVGTWTVTGTYTALVDTALVTVIHGTATTFSIAPAAATVTAGEQVVYTATATDACANEWNATGETAFSVNDSWGSMTTQGTYTAGMVGNWIVKGTHTPTGKVGTASVIVTHGAAMTFSIAPATKTVTAGEQVVYTATARDACANEWNATGETTFSVNDSWGSMTTQGTYTAGMVGNWIVKGTHTPTGKIGTASVTVTHGTAITFSIAPATATVTAGEQQVYTATATDACANEWNATGETVFSVNDINGSMTTHGTYTAGMVGDWIVRGTYTTLVGTASVTVTHGEATTFSIAPATATVTAGDQKVYTATARDACANEWNATGETVFSVNDSWGSMTAHGTYTAGMVDNWIVKGTHTPTGKVGTASVTVTHGTAITFSIAPATATVTAGEQQVYTATARDACANEWNATGETVFSVNDSKGSITTHGTYTAGKVGTWTVTGTYTTLVDTASVTVIHGTAASLDITPKDTLVWVLSSVTYSATAMDINGNTWTVTGSTTFGVTDPFGSMTNNVYTASSKGTWTITGTYTTAVGSTTVIASVRPNLYVIKLGEEEVRQGDPMTYYLCYGNEGCSQADGVTLKDILPPGVSYSTSTIGTPAVTGNGTAISPYILTWNIKSIPSVSVYPEDAERDAEITVTVGSNTVGSLTNVAEIATSVPDSECNFEFNRSTFTTVAKARMIDLAVSKLSVPEVLQGATLTYKITYNNLGNIDAANVTLTDYLPQGVSYVGNTLGTPTLSNNSKTIVWSINSLAPKTPIEFELIVKAANSALGNITNVVSIHGTKTEVNLSNNQATCVTVVKPSDVDLVIQKQGPGVAKPNQQIKYSITCHNNSQIMAANVIITDTLPSGTTYATSTLGTPTTSANNSSQMSWVIGTLTAQERKNFELTVNIGSSTTGEINNVVTITSNQKESNPADNRATSTTTVIMPIDLKISKSGSQTVGLGTDVSYLIEYQRLSGGDVTATITDTLPRGTTYVDSTLGTPTSISGNSYSWQVTIATSAVQSATITVHVPETLTIGTSLTNHVAIIPSDDSNWTDNFDTWTSTTDESITDVEILKYGSWQAIPGGKIVYSFWLNNIGETPITAATITDKLPIGLTYVTNTNQRMMGTAAITEWTRQDIQVPQQGTVTGIGATLVWTIHNTLPAGSRTLTEVLLDVCPHIVQYSTTQSASQTLGYTNEYIINNIRVETTPQDNNIENNEDTHITQIAHITNADLYIGKSGPYESCPGNVIRYRIYGGNYGYSDAGGVKLVDTMPIGVTLESIEYAYAGGLQIGTTPTTMATITGWGNRKQQVLTWNIGTISANSGIYTTSFPDTVQPNRFYLNITARIADNILPTGWTSINLDNTVEISTTSPENSLYRNTCAVKTIVIPRQVDLHIWKSGPRECAPNDRIAYNIGCYNNGPDMAHTVTITDTLPPGVEYATDTSGLPLDIGTLSTGGQRLTWTVGTLCALSNYGYWWQYYKSFKLEVKVGTLTINTSLTNKVEIKSMDVEKTPANNNAKCRTIVKCPAVDLTIKKYGPAKVIRGDNNDLWYYIWFTNNGNTTADNVTIVDTLPHGAKYKNYYGSCYNWLYNRYQRIGTPTLSPNKQVVTWEIGDLPPNSSGYITLMVNANTEGYANQQDMYNKVTISSQQPDSNPNNNYADYKTRVVNPVTNLHVIKHGPKKVSPGQEMTYTIHYGNAGNTAARDIEIVDTLDKGVTYMSSGIDYKYPPQIIGDKVIWRIPRIRHGFNTNFDVRVLVAGSISTKVICNKVVITVLPTDHNPKNNSSEWKTRVVEQKADLSVVITADIARPGFKKNLYVTCTNEGTGKADNVVVTLRLPAKNHATYDYSCPQGDYNASLNTVTWSVGSLPPDKSKHYRAKILVKASTPRGTRLYSKATVSTTSQESDNKNNKAREHEDVIRSYDPNMKTASPQDYVAATATSISYTIHFENIGQANATKIKLDDQLTDKLDWSTVAIKDVCVGGTVSTISEFNIQLRDKLKAKLDPLVPSQYTQEEADEIVEMSGLRVWWHPSMGTVSWEFDFGDYEFGLPPNNPLDEGTGWVRFTVNTIGTLTSGTEIENQATIKFDYNEPMNTPVVKHIVDGTAPVSHIILDPYQVSSTFTVGWLGTDQVGKIDSYEVYAAKDNGTPTLWGSFVENSASYVGIVGSTYTFSCKARDMAGNVGSMSDAVSTRVLPPATEAGTLTRVIISPASVSMELDETIMLTAQGFNENGELMAGISYSWGTSTGFAVIGTPTNAVTVKAIGIGSVTMRVTAAKNAASATTTGTYTISTGALDRITIEGTPTSMELNQQVMFVGRGFNKFGAEIPGQTFTWRIQDAEVGSITAAGTTSTSATVTAKTSGSGWVTAIAGEKQGTLQISVGDGIVATVTVSGTTTLQLGQAAVFTAKAYNKFGCELPDKIATWEIAPAPPLCNFTPSGASSAMLTAQAPGIGTLTGTADDIHGHLAITIIQGMPTKLAITQSAQTVSAGIASEAIVVQAQNEFSASVDVTSPMTVTVTSDSLLSRFSTAASGAAWTSGTAATYVIPAGTGSISLYHKYNGTATPAIAITVNAANMTAASQSITITALGTASAGNIVADDGKTMVTLKAGDLVGASFIEINTNPTPPGVNAPDGLVIMAQTLRQIKLIGAGLSSGTTVTVTLPYSEVNLVGNGEDSLQPYRLGTSSTTWESISNISRNTVNNTVSGVVGSFSFFALMMPAWNTTLKNVVVYPNPCITEKHGYQMYFANLTQNSTIKIFNIAGELVKEIAVDNPTEIWKIDNDDGERVASGLYIYLITDPASNRKVGKMAIIK